MKQILFVKSFVGRIKSIYRKRTQDGLTVYFKFETGENISMISAEDTEDLFDGLKKGDIITIKSTQGKVIFVKKGVYLPEDGKKECIDAENIYGKDNKYRYRRNHD